jgi:site-specific DNA-methyltransferase (adenine-specific)
MKFDCVIGNPPYQHNSKSKGNKLWPKFIVKSMELVMENGYLAMVTPDSWMAGGSNIPGNIGILKDVFRPNTLLYVNVADVGKKYFPNVGLSFSWWIASKTISKILTKMETSWGISTVDINSIDFFPAILHPTMQSIYKKVYSTRSFDVISFDRQNTKNGDAKSEKKTRIHKIKHWILGSDIDNKIQYCYLPYDNSPAISNHKKVVFPLRKFSNFHPYVDMKGISVCQQGFCVFLDKHDTEDGVKSVWHSKLMKFLLFSCFPGNFLKTNIVKSLPYISMKKVWTDQELYEHFGLTQEEIDYIEANTK